MQITITTSAATISLVAGLIKNGSGTLTISVTNDVFTGGTYINGGTIKLADQNFVFPYGGGALNNNLGNVTIGNGGTLDINGVQVPNFQSFGPEGYNVFLSGAGVGGNGALVNNNTNDNDLADPGYVTLIGNATVGGIGDVNVRHGVAPQLSSQDSSYTLTKVGPGQFRVRYITAVSTNFGPINILQGIVSYESSSPLGFGDPTKNITIGSGGGFAWGTTNTACTRTLIASNNASILGYNTTNNVFKGPVTLVSGNVNLNANFYNGMIFSNVLSGAGGITLLGQTRVSLAAANTYSGNTVVVNCNGTNGNNNGSILRLVGSGSINNSASITLQGIVPGQSFPGALDASGRSDGTLTLASGQTLRGDNGSWVKGNVIASSGSTITPGGAANIQSMVFSNNLALQAGSTVAMDISLDSGITNDLIRTTGSNTYAGTLQIASIGATALTNGASFKLFSSATFSGNFASISGSAGTGLGYSFNPTNGILTVVSTGSAPPPPKFKQIFISGTNIIITATNNSATGGGTYTLLGTNNVAAPLATWPVISTGNFDSTGNIALTNAIGTSNEFFLLRVP
jgi:fibronectin-binding autotransporter adhesin